MWGRLCLFLIRTSLSKTLADLLGMIVRYSQTEWQSPQSFSGWHGWRPYPYPSLFPTEEPLRCCMVLMFTVTVTNFLASLVVSLGLLLEPPLQWRTAGVDGSGSWALCEDAFLPKHSLVRLGAISSFVEPMAALPRWITTFWLYF
ncbi:Hypothetical predicted protein [Olea europaea subsp. europaea]|uniref:Uncharacterized protein n=1 Tax=Olea europaea subsp. europaea TaxID=158383 RepID=A0A8S0S172_OLEEU|nr:Hypothetical predicted protein [Olea europaea subsp. europaea]